MSKRKLVETYEVWNSGGHVYVVSGKLTDGTWFMANFGDESIISIYATEDAMMESMGEYGEDFIRNLAPRNPMSRDIYREIFEDAMADDSKASWYHSLVVSAKAEYEDVLNNEELLNELDEWEESSK